MASCTAYHFSISQQKDELSLSQDASVMIGGHCFSCRFLRLQTLPNGCRFPFSAWNTRTPLLDSQGLKSSEEDLMTPSPFPLVFGGYLASKTRDWQNALGGE